MSLWSRLTNAFRSDRLDEDLDDEQRFHIEARDAFPNGATSNGTRPHGSRVVQFPASDLPKVLCRCKRLEPSGSVPLLSS